jgi:acyl carrier protein
MEHIFTDKIKEILQNNFGEDAEDIFDKNHLLQYINS